MARCVPATCPSAATPICPSRSEDYREREAFLLEILELGEQLEDAGDAASDHRRDLMQLYGAINGGGVRQGTLHPPTATQREQLERIKRRFAAAAGAGGRRVRTVTA